ncbi:hypothetical protein BKA67DRAFT_571346 [Truncatella angustata]|uniref:Uncharacterized protein n=1 Tax=Truncatella angustata TaxID=152316 RepID=A0A9P8UGA7_9PEZI|nr:uncharacterized protein BKA67DRAFT_571346 [Truncatella angustata]KAH6651608.1 hypothetical protein BKA67DRAFT_571346 [Truncatella angustata]
MVRMQTTFSATLLNIPRTIAVASVASMDPFTLNSSSLFSFFSLIESIVEQRRHLQVGKQIDQPNPGFIDF